MDKSEIFRQRLKEIRLKRDWSQAELARQAGITPAAVNQFEKGPRMPSLPILQNIAAALDVSIDYLAGVSDHPNEPKVADQFQSFYRSFSNLSDQDRKILEAQLEILQKKSEQNE